MIEIKDILTPDRILIECHIKSKKRVLQLLSQLLPEQLEDITPQEILSCFVKRENLGSTAIGHGTALPHARIAGLEQPLAAYIQLHDAIEYDTEDHHQVKFFFGLIVPEDCNAEHLHLLSQIAERFHDEAFRTAISDAKTPEEVCQLFAFVHT